MKRILLLAFLLLVSCSDVKKHLLPPSNNEGGASPSESVGPPPVFPHLEGWKEPASHGAWVTNYGSAPCFQCHQASGDAVKPPTCNSCHAAYPHPDGWEQREGHGATVLKSGRNSCTTQCHGYDLKGGLTGLSCTKCHTVYPHPDGWKDPRQHGEASRGEARTICKSCHGEDLGGGTTGVACSQCHTLYPHPADWGTPEKHGAFVLKNGQTGCATQCHGTDLKGGVSKVSCTSCHEVYPHPDGWDQRHGPKMKQLGKAACQICHGTDFKNSFNDKNCYSCHADYPHPDPSVWDRYLKGHGEKVRVTYQGSTASCELCHGADLTKRQEGRNCSSCHPAYPHKKLSDNWRSYEGHGQFGLRNRWNSCGLCHGGDFKGGPRGNPSCFTCHPPFPHSTAWLQAVGQVQEHGLYVLRNTSSSCATAHCHGEGLNPQPGVAQGIGCAGCHPNYPHTDEWKRSGLIHGPPARVQIESCKACHGEQLGRVPVPGMRRCVDCHPSYLQHTVAGVGATGWESTGHGRYIMGSRDMILMEECQHCHGTDLQGGMVNRSCLACHPTFPTMHQQPNWGTGEGHGAYVHANLPPNDFTACKTCHGNDLSGGTAGVSCFSCHTAFPHTADWQGAPHGTVARDLTARTGCRDCHGADLSGGTAGVACNSCHTNFPHPEAASWTAQRTVRRQVCTTDEDGGEVCSDVTDIHISPHAQQFFDQKTAGFPASNDRCSNCHGSDYQGGNSLRACGSCHSYPHREVFSDWVTETGGRHTGTYLGGALGFASPCTTCHTSFGNGPDRKAPACGNCHPQYPHLRPPDVSATDDWQNRRQHGMQFIMGEMGESWSLPPNPPPLNPCKQCHGTDLHGAGLPAKDCTGCHAHYGKASHKGCCRVADRPPSTDATWWRRPANHGEEYLQARLEGDPNRCNTCHGAISRDPARVCNPFRTQFPGSGLDWCSSCHTMPAGGCPADGCAATGGVCP